MTDTHYMTCAETAKLIRKALKEAFPGFKFSVRSHTYSMGASIYVRWDDGPTTKEVEAVARVFAGATFDGMTDYKGGVVHQFDGCTVHFGADFIFCNRNVTDKMLAGVRQGFAALGDDERFELMKRTDAQQRLTPFERPDSYMLDADLSDFGQAAETVFRTMAEGISLQPPAASPTAEAVAVVRTY